MAVPEKIEGTAASLPDDVVREILVRLENVVDLFRCAVSCKQMRRVILEPSFLHRLRWPGSTLSFLSGLFIWEKYDHMAAPTFVTSFVPTKYSLFGPHRLNLKSFLPTSGARGCRRGLLHNTVPLVARHGFVLLLRLDMPNVNVDPASTVWLAVCNLFSGACDELPPLRCDWDFDKSGYTILTSADCSSNVEQQPSVPPGYSAFFKVLIIETDIDQQPRKLHKFTSGEPSWSCLSKLSSKARGDNWELRHPRAVVWRGMAHWLIGYCVGCYYSSLHTIDVDAETCRVSVTKIETPTEYIRTEIYDGREFIAFIVDVDGLLSVFRRRGSQLERWTRQEDGDPTRWLRTQFMELKPPVYLMPHLIVLEKKGGMLLVQDYHYRGHVYTIDLETGVREEVAHFARSNCRQVVPLEMDWPTLFISRLSAREL